MKYDIQDTGGETKVALEGRITFADHEDFHSVIETLEKSRQKLITFDLSRVDFIDSAGLGMLLIARETAVERNAEITLKGAQDQVKKIFTTAKFDELFTIA